MKRGVEFLPSNCQIGLCKINSLDLGSSCRVGQTCVKNYNHTIKRNNGFGENIGDRTQFIHPIQVIDDADIFDSNASKSRHRSS